ncbi:MAG: phenylalanine--tRNA ligase subunit alpha [Thermodesulfovibrionales bacterium]|nr:phenylalanine--tRNA ligase subunit alpha [Thermodesulfovibrionales bacterium]
MENPEILKEEFEQELKALSQREGLSALKARYLGKKGIIAEAIKALQALPKEERPLRGKILNELKEYIERRLSEKEKELAEAEYFKKITSEKIDITIPGRIQRFGAEHPLTKTLREIIDIFSSMGFSVEEGPEVELDYYNFEALNIPKDHPARDMQDTFYITDEILLRTHTSPVQIRVMEKKKPPLRMIAPGKVYRCDADVTHSPMFHQVEGLMVGEDVSMANLKAVLELFLRELFGPQTPIRFRPSYFPFTEPSAEVDIGCLFCSQQGCRICKNSGWLEILGAGMVHPEVFRAVGYDTEKYTGFAFGLGVERIAMLRYRIDDIRLFYENNLMFLEQF